jgi:hypothetical protein
MEAIVVAVPPVARRPPQLLPRPRYRHWWVIVLAALAVIAVLCTGASLYAYRALAPSSGGALRAGADKVVLPPDFILVGESSSGNALCLDECSRYQRSYSTSRSPRDAYMVVTAALRKAGYQCVEPCEPGHEWTWHGPHLTIELSMSPGPGDLGNTTVEPSADPGRETDIYLNLESRG